MSLLSDILSFLMQWYIILPVIGLFVFLTWKNYKKNYTEELLDSDLLILEIPKTNDKSELAAEQLFASLHGIFRNKEELKANGNQQEHLSFEIASINGQIRFYVWVPKTLRNFVEGQIYSQYPTVQIHKAEEDYVLHERMHSVVYSSEITLSEADVLPIKTFQSFEVDPLAGITGTLAKLESTGEEIWIQILARPIADSWNTKTDAWVSKLRKGSSKTVGVSGSLTWFVELAKALWQPPTMGEGSKVNVVELSDRDKTRISEAEKKATKLGYEVKIRLVYLGESTVNARQRMQAIVGTFKQFNSTNLNGFKMTSGSFNKQDIDNYKSRLFGPGGFLLNIEELASVFHLPHTNVETPNIVWANSKTAEPPAKLPIITGTPEHDENISAFGLTNFRGINHQFGLYRKDRGSHVYVIGQTGTGKSKLLELFALSDIFHGHGYAIIDPHGDFAINNMRFIPGSRLKDVIYFNPADTNYPLGFNPLEVTDPRYKNNISSEVIGVLKRMFDYSWGPRLEYILRYTILALLDRPSTTMLDITRMLTDKQFRNETLSYCQDTVVLNFWKIEFASWNEKFATEAVAPILNKVGAFTANPTIRNIIGQPKSTFNIRQIMDEGKILIVNLSRGLIGEDNAGILGAFLVTKIQLAAMSRSDIINAEDRRPFYLYVDEFQNFATDSFAVILSEARKYGLNLVVANQYISQMDENVRGAVFGNVGTIVSFRVSADDAPMLANQFEPQFTPSDLLQLHNRHFVISMVINTEKVPAFSATSLSLPVPQIDNIDRIVEHTRYNYSRSRDDIEQEISLNIAQPQHLQNPKQEPKNHATPHKQQEPKPAHKPAEKTSNEPTGQERPARKKRTRSRSKNTSNTPHTNEATSKQRLHNEDEGKLVIKHIK